MNRHAISASLLLSALLGAATLAPARAGGAITRCVDSAGRITLTDQPCDAHTVSSSIAVPGMQDAAPPVRPPRWRPAAAPHAALAGDIATLKQARTQLMLQDIAPRTRLASLER